MKTLGATVLVALSFWARSLLAQPAPTPVYIAVHLAPQCQGVSDFGQRLLSRTRRLRWANPGEAGIAFDVVAQPYQTGFVGQLQIRELDGRYTQRSVEGKTCDGVINALAFVAAVLVDSESAQSIEPTTSPPPAPAPPAVEQPSSPTTPSGPSYLSWGIGATLGGTTATSASPVQPNAGARLMLAWDSPGFAPWVTLGFDQRFNSKVSSTLNASSSQALEATFGGWTAHMDLSPIRWPAQGHNFVRPTATFEIGQVLSSSTTAPGVVTMSPQSRTWLASGLGASAEARISTPFAAIADVSLLFPIRWLDYYYDTSGGGEVHPFTVPAVGLSVRLGILAKFE